VVRLAFGVPRLAFRVAELTASTAIGQIGQLSQ
jgi:hypothetical protein